MPQYDFICEYCGWKTTQPATAVGHACPKNGKEVTECVRLDSAVPVDICCDGCEAERLGVEHHAYSDKVSRESARAAGWECHTKTGDWCPACVLKRKAPV